jgi:hypothetical protein
VGGNVKITAGGAGPKLEMSFPGAGIVQVDTFSGVVTVDGLTVNVTYIPVGFPANWAGGPPALLAAAIDRCAAAIVARTIGGPI